MNYGLSEKEIRGHDGPLWSGNLVIEKVEGAVGCLAGVLRGWLTGLLSLRCMVCLPGVLWRCLATLRIIRGNGHGSTVE